MDLFEGADVSTDVQAEKDQVRGQKQAPLESGIYNLIVKHAYADKAKSGALGIRMAFTIDTPEGRLLRQVEYVLSGDKKGNKSYYEKKNADTGKMEKFNLPGFTTVNDLCQIIAGKSITACAAEKRTIKLYDFNQKAEVPTEVDMLVDLVGKPVSACITQVIEDKTKMNDASGEYEPTGETFTKNEIIKFLDPQTRKTVSETGNNIEADYQRIWLDKWEGEVDDRSSDVKDAGMKGAPAANGAAAAKTSLFS